MGIRYIDDQIGGNVTVKHGTTTFPSRGTLAIDGDNVDVTDTGSAIQVQVHNEHRVATVADLRAHAGAVGERASLSGKRGGEFERIASGTDDDGTVFVATGYGTTGAAWKRIYEGARNVLWFDADDTGVTDTEVALTRAFADGGKVYVPGGTYRLGAQLDLVSTLHMVCDPETTFMVKGGTTHNTAIGGTSLAGITIEGLTLDVNGTNRTAATNTLDGFRLVTVSKMNMIGVTVMGTLGKTGGGTAVAYALTAGDNVKYIGCNALSLGIAGRISDGFYSNGTHVTYDSCYAEPTDTGFVFENCSESTMLGCTSKPAISGQGAGFAIGVAGNTDIHGCTIIGCKVRGVAAPVEFGIFGAPTNTGKLIGSRIEGLVVDSNTSGFPAVLFYPNPQVNPANTISAVDAGANTLTSAGHGLTTSHRVYISSSGNMPGNVSNLTSYWVVSPTSDTFQISLTQNGAAVDISSAGSGTISWIHAYQGRIEDTVISGLQVVENGGSQGIFATSCDRLQIEGCYFNVDAAAVQTGEGNPSKITISGCTGDINTPATIGFQFANGVDEVSIQGNRLRGGSTMVWGAYFFGTCTNLRVQSQNIFTSSGGLNDESGVGAELAATQPRAAADGPFYVTTTPQPGTGIWPVGTVLINTDLVTSSPYIETAAKPAGWIVTTAGVPGSGAVFTPFFREGRTEGEAGTLNSANAYHHVRTPASGSHYVAYNARGDSADATKYVGFGFSNASNAAGNLGYIGATGNGDVRIAALTTRAFSLGFTDGSNFPGTYSEAAQVVADGINVPGNDDGYTLGSGAADGGFFHAQSVAAGVIQYCARVRGELAINSNDAFPWATVTTGLYWRTSNGVTAIGIGADPSDRAAYLSCVAPSTSNNAACWRPGVGTTVLLEGAQNHISGTGWTFVHGALTANFTAVASDNKLTSTGHGLSNGDTIYVSNSGGALPAPLVSLTPYYVISSAANDFKVSATSGGSEIDLTTDGTGTQTFKQLKRFNQALKLPDVSYNFNPGGILTTAQIDITITVPGASVGDKVLVDFTAGGLDAGLICGGMWVSAVNTVKVRIYNPTAGTITPASVNWNVSVIHT